MAKKVTASTSGMVMPTTKPGRTSSVQRRHKGFSPGRLCKPSAKKLTASTMTTASIKTLMNSLTELDTAEGWSCTCLSVMPAGNWASNCCVLVFKALPKAMMSPPLVMLTPSATTCSPSCRTLTVGGST